MRCSSLSSAFGALPPTPSSFHLGCCYHVGLTDIINEDIPSLHDENFEDLSYPMYKEIASYGKYMEEPRQLQGTVSKTEHNTFVFFWLYKFFICSNFLAMVNEYSYYITAIISSRPMNLGALFISLFYEGLKLRIGQLKAKENKTIPDLMWFLFLWANEYFPKFYRDYSLTAKPARDASTYILCYKIIPISTISAFQIADWLFKMKPRVYLEIYPFLVSFLWSCLGLARLVNNF